MLEQFGSSLAEGHGLASTSRWPVLLTLTITCSLGLVASTIYVPSVPAIAAALATTVSRVQLTFVGYLAAFAVSMLVLGPLSDRFGRRRTMILAVSLSAVGSAGCAMSPSIEFLIGARILQGIGLSGGMVVGRATVRDLYGESGAAQVIAGLSVVLTLLQAFAPIPGGYLQAWVGWRANFAAITAFAGAALALVLAYVPASSGSNLTRPQNIFSLARATLAGYRSLMQNRRFTAYALTAAGAHAGFHIFAAGAPAVLILTFGISPQDYGYYASLPPIGFLIGSFVSSRLTESLGVDRLITIGSTVLIPAGFAMVFLAVLHIGNPYAIVGPMILVCCASGLITPNAVAGSLGVKVGIIGAASGLASFLQMIGAVGATAALSLGPGGNAVVLAVVVASAGCFSVTAFGASAQSGHLPEKAGVRASV